MGPFEVLDEGGLYGLSVNSTDNEVGEAAVIGLETLGALSESEEACECGGVVACSYVSKLLLERCHLLSPHPVGKGVLGLGCVESGLLLVRLALNLVSPFEGSLGHLLSQYGLEFGGKAVSQVFELRIAGSWGDGEIRVKEVVDKRFVESRGDL